MSKHGLIKYERMAHDHYPTPPETTEVIMARIRFSDMLCDPCCGPGRKMLRVFRRHGHEAVGSDLIYGYDFLTSDFKWRGADICTNPPYGGKSGRLAVKFVIRALEVTRRRVAMLLPADFDSGSSRSVIFGDCPAFSQKIVLTNRIRWFNDAAGTTNHAWFVWDRRNRDRPRLAYASQEYPT